MFRQIKDALFVNNKMGEKQEKNNYDEVEIAIAALLVEAACSDGVFDDEERKSIRAILVSYYKLSEEKIESLILEAEEIVQDSLYWLVIFLSIELKRRAFQILPRQQS